MDEDKHIHGKRITLTRTIESMINGRTDANRYTNIRQHASNQTKTRPQVCAICKYDKHVENTESDRVFGSIMMTGSGFSGTNGLKRRDYVTKVQFCTAK